MCICLARFKSTNLFSDILEIGCENVYRYLEEKRKKKQKNSETELDFPGREQVKFGDVVQAPPKLLVVPKVHLLILDIYMTNQTVFCSSSMTLYLFSAEIEKCPGGIS